MRRPILIVTAFYVLGILLQHIVCMSYETMIYIFFINIIVGIFIYRKGFVVVLFSIILLLGSLNFKVNNEYEGQLESFFEKKLYVIGDVIDVSYKYKERIVMTLKVEAIVMDGKKYRLSRKIYAKLKGQNDGFKSAIGKRIGVYGTLLEPQKRRNPKMFDYNMYLKGKNIYGILYGDVKRIEIIGKGNISFVIKKANRIKNKIVLIISKVLPKKEGGIFLGILLGDKDNLDQNIYTTFKKVGVAHILAVSGLHVGILYMYIQKLLKDFSITIRTFIILAILSFYVIITGYAPSVLRATSMTIILVLAPLFNRRYDSLSAIATAGLIFLIVNPLYLFDTGFQLSFIAAFVIILFYKPILHKLKFIPESIRQILSVSMAAQIGIIPVVAYHFNYISLGAFIVNIPIVIIVSFIVPIGLIMIMIGFISISMASVLGWLVSILIRVMVALSEFIEAIPFSNVEVVSPSFYFIFFYYAFFMIWVIGDKKIKDYSMNKRKGMGIVIGVYVTIAFSLYLLPGKMEITFVDVGQGDCILIKTPMKKNILIDGGGSLQNRIDIGEDILVPFLRKNGISCIDLMILSHIHKDHIGGLISVLDHLRVKTFIMGTDYYQSEDFKTLKEKCIKQKTKIYQCLKNDKIKIEKNVNLKFIHPGKSLVMSSGDDINNNSLITLMEYKGYNLLFTGDVEAEGEQEILRSYPKLSVDVLKVAHHGSNSSSTDAFLGLVRPKVAVIQVGKNLHGHPHKNVLERLKEKNTAVFRNDQDGAVIVTLDKQRIGIKTMLHE
ncbi:DNA internalization-related competence protein ComEC/Rec2 [Crassaminicella profunda]|uniref:DNA internalization-related competence protein ComEC/Rec2 n=1 Tax=Crassaminicella profunda TaxID=1286698 RepID=UPI001CA77043|nr:DNA internalization-related competence protein ComEC/Rec2 [Crassaminicella profunda]QZY56530.1 DNA internalization-related competence protein ComEC/Rec2 [Crassaminicella profunda]